MTALALPADPQPNDVTLLADRAFRYAGSVWRRDPANDGATALTIAAENARVGYPEVNWQVSGAGDLEAVGFARAMSVEAGEDIEFSIHTDGDPYSLEIVRLGWYDGDGARLVDTLSNDGSTQSNGTLRTQGEGGTGSRDCAAWTVTDTWTVPADATHGLYLAVIKRSGAGEFAHVGPFIVTNDRSRAARIMVKTSDMTWHAYNAFGTTASPLSGRGLYGASGTGTMDQGNRAWDVSYDRPLIVTEGVPQTSYWNGERPVHAWLERNGYDVAYTSCLDVHSDATLLDHQVIVSCGHDEYWTQAMRDHWNAAIDGGAHAVILSGNTMLWRTRIDAGNARRVICYKDSHSLDSFGSGEDPVSWTGTWRDTRWADRDPENTTIGAMFMANGIRADEIVVPDEFADEPLWRDTPIAELTSGSVTLKTDCLGFEWDSFTDHYANSMGYPDGIKLLSETSVNLTDNTADENGSIYTTDLNPAVHHIVAFKRGSSVTVNFGTNQWGWGLSDKHVRGSAGENTTMKQATVNLLADLGCQPGTLQSGLTPATNQLGSWAWPTIVSVTVAPSTVELEPAQTVQLSAAAAWSNGIVTDVTKTAVWASSAPGVATVDDGLVAAVDDGTATITATVGAESDTCSVTVEAAGEDYDSFKPISESYGGTIHVDGAVEVGTRFHRVGSSNSLLLHGVRYWRGTNSQSAAPIAYFCGVNAGAATVSKTSPAGSGAPGVAGWETILFDDPIEINDSGDYAVWVWLPSGGYAATSGWMVNTGDRVSVPNGLITNLPSGGRYRQPPAGTNGNAEPVEQFDGGYYWVDPLVTLAP